MSYGITVTVIFCVDNETGQCRKREFENSAHNWTEFVQQMQRKFNLYNPVEENYKFSYCIKDRDGKEKTEKYDLGEDDEFQYALKAKDGICVHIKKRTMNLAKA